MSGLYAVCACLKSEFRHMEYILKSYELAHTSKHLAGHIILWQAVRTR